MWQIGRDGIAVFADFLSQCISEAPKECSGILLSGEDFENCVVDTDLARQIEFSAHELGISEVVWFFVKRKPKDYVASIYAEMSKHGVVLNYSDVAHAAVRFGFFAVSTENFNYFFALDFSRFSREFINSVKGDVFEFTMSDFLEDFVGASLLTKVLGDVSFAEFSRDAVKFSSVENRREGSFSVEYRYCITFLGLRYGGNGGLRSRIYSIIFFPIILARILKRQKAHAKIFGASSEAVSD